MQINITSKGIKLNDELRSLIETGIGSIENRFKGDTSCRVTLKPVENNNIKVSVLIYSGKYVFKGECVHLDRNVAFNKAIKEIERNCNKMKTKHLMQRYMPDNVKAELLSDENEPEEDTLADINNFITTKKELKVLPMNIEEAYMQLELLGHSFLAFINKDSGLINILYRKRNSDEACGVIELTR